MNVNLIDDLIAHLPADVAVKSVWVGVHWTAVISRHCGLASTLTGNQPHGHARVRDVGRLHFKSAHELAEYARSDNLLEASIGVAAINSLLDVDESRVTEMNAADVLAQRGRGRHVALIGHFPFIAQLRASAGELWVIEQQPVADEYPPEAAADLIPRAEVVAITASTIINHTLDGLLALRDPNALVIVLGPSTPLSPVLFEHGVSILSGAQVIDEAAALRTLGQGATFQQMEGVRLVTLARNMDRRQDQLIATLSSLAKDRAERDLIAATIAALDARYDLSRKMAKEPGVEEIIKQLLGRLVNAFGNLSSVKDKRILDIACGSNTSKAPSAIYIDTPFGEKSISTADIEGYTAQFEPWFCRVLLQLGAHAVGIDFGSLEGEAFEHYRVDLGHTGALDFLPGQSFDAVQDSRLFGSPEFTAQFPDPADRLKVATEIYRQERRLLKAGGRVIHSDAEELTGRRHTSQARS